MRKSSLLTAAVFVFSLATCTGAIAANFSGVPDYPQQQTLYPTDPPGQPQLQPGRTGPYDGPDFVVPEYETNS